MPPCAVIDYQNSTKYVSHHEAIEVLSSNQVVYLTGGEGWDVQFVIGNAILNMKMTNSYHDSCDIAIFENSSCQKLVKLHLYCHNF